MAPLLRLLFVCLMALALPVQGLAAARMMHGAGHASRSSPAGDHGGHRCGDHHAVAGASAADGHGHAAHDAGSAAGHQCSACAACCVAMALPTTWPAPAAPPGASFAPPPAGASPHSVVPRLPDRPPRQRLA